MKKALLVLEDGFTLEGSSFTGDFECGGEVIFATSMSGYQEILTDPSYYGQMICMTYPLIGNYGVAPEDMESAKIHATALLVRECCQQPSNWRAKMSLPEFLHQYNTPGMENLDTRALTRHLRIKGAMRGIISTEETSPTVLQDKARQLPTMQGFNPIRYVSPTSPYIWQDNAPCPIKLEGDGSYKWQGTGIRLLVYDFGVKWNILRLLVQTGFEILVVPPAFSCQSAVASGAKAVFLSNGPGDPAAMSESINLVRELLQHFPVTGICLGHQLIASALGGKTTKLTFGHHGVNHPVKCLASGRVEITSQNHGFCVLADGLKDVEITHINLNDGTVEGLRHKHLPIMSVQYHPEANAGPHDSNYLFASFRDLLARSA